jgi:acetyl-CoA carboxylase carboxyl transferase subunit beta
MGWFKRTKQTIEAAAVKPEDMWVICPSCKAHIFKEEWHKGLKVCPKCNFHDRLTCRE